METIVHPVAFDPETGRPIVVISTDSDTKTTLALWDMAGQPDMNLPVEAHNAIHNLYEAAKTAGLVSGEGEEENLSEPIVMIVHSGQ